MAFEIRDSEVELLLHNELRLGSTVDTSNETVDAELPVSLPECRSFRRVRVLK